jgi:hypothetical protein
MKKITVILSILVFITSSCGQKAKNQAETVDQQEEKETARQADKIHTDTFEYFDYSDLYDYPFFIIKKDNQNFTLLDDCSTGKNFALNRGDSVEIQWKTDSTRMAGGNEVSSMTLWAVNIKKTADGKLSVFRKTNNKPRSYIFMENNQPVEYQTALINEVEYFLANTTDKNILQYLKGEEGDIQIYISSYGKGETGKGYPTVTARIDNYDKNEHTLIQLGIEFDNKNFERKYYRFDKEKNEYIQLK